MEHEPSTGHRPQLLPYSGYLKQENSKKNNEHVNDLNEKLNWFFHLIIALTLTGIADYIFSQFINSSVKCHSSATEWQ